MQEESQNLDLNNPIQKKMVQWSDDLSYGIKGMDDDHKVMITLVNRMHAILEEQKDSFDVRLLLAKLGEYAIVHFRREEIVMETCKYPESDEHIDYHHQLEKQVFELLKNKNKHFDADETHALLHFLSNWLFEHISTVDQKMAPYVAKYLDEIDVALKDTDSVEDLVV